MEGECSSQSQRFICSLCYPSLAASEVASISLLLIRSTPQPANYYVVVTMTDSNVATESQRLLAVNDVIEDIASERHSN